jgi:hypothetical protein
VLGKIVEKNFGLHALYTSICEGKRIFFCWHEYGNLFHCLCVIIAKEGGNMKRNIWLSHILLIVLMWGAGTTVVAQKAERKQKTKKEGRLGDFEDETQKEDEKNEEDSDNKTHPHHEREGIGDIWLIARLTYGVLVQFPNEQHFFFRGDIANSGYSKYPYEHPAKGLFSQSGGKRQAIIFHGGYFYDNSDLDGVLFRGYFSPHPLLSLEIHFANLQENLPTYNDRLQIYGAFANYNRLRLERFTFRWGVGVMGIRGDDVTNGIAFNINFTWYVTRPLSLELNYSGGYIGSKFVPDVQVNLNTHFQRLALTIGYQYWSAGNTTLDGLTTGVAIFL